ncbi:CopG family ribbon-helix-helix protein [Endothiovibrio diazotrophicus]
MSTFSIRLDDELSSAFDREAQLCHKKRSELAREVLAEYVRRRENERYMAGLAKAARALATDPEAQRESREIAEEFLAADNEALAIAEGRDPDVPWPEEQWWK